ncbi:MAG: hypothetical protein GWN30_08710, partial [Gammaproteobacteria bacterium]|nr:hypothetical protein [candidate division Zixibacteria bacterium]NIW44830.1 hypothetical protein [Gammaproteobacteria bacterium]
MVYTYTLRADSADGENIDAMILHVPSGWEVIEFSDAPPKNTSCDGNSVASIAYMDERDVIYWGNDITRPDNWENLSTPPDDIDRSECGIYEANGTSEITFWFRVRIGLDAETCPGAPNFVG